MVIHETIFKTKIRAGALPGLHLFLTINDAILTEMIRFGALIVNLLHTTFASTLLIPHRSVLWQQNNTIIGTQLLPADGGRKARFNCFEKC
jgi:hypothetical protein